MTDNPEQRPPALPLRFRPAAEDEAPSVDLSAAVEVGRDLWIAGDEGATIERLSRADEGDGYGAHASFRLGDYLDLPDDRRDEVDVEGIDHDDGCLWVVGSHSRRRRAIDGRHEADTDRDRFRRLGRTGRPKNRAVLARIPLVPDPDAAGSLRPARKTASEGGTVRAAVLRATRRGNELLDALADDRHLAPFLRIPGKENGLDVEGLAVRDGRVHLGLRGPVLHGWAVALVVAPKPDGDELRLTAVGPKKRPYEKHLLDLRGLGIRELCADGDDLLILAGPTMQLDGDAAIFRWPGALNVRGDSIVPRDRLHKVVDLPYGRGERENVDHPEGLALLRADGARRLLVLYDTPSEARRLEGSGVLADVFPAD